jgi:hypothetical protein
MKRKSKWTKEEEFKVLTMAQNGWTTEEIAKELNRSYKSIQHRRADLSRGETKMVKQTREEPKEIDINKTLIQVLKDELRDVKPYISSPQTKHDVKGDTLVIQITDLHAGKIVKNQEGEVIYNEDVFRKRINRLCEQTLKLLDNNISKGVPIRDVVLLLTGDLANGEGIYATQAYEQEIAPPAQVMLVIDVLTKLITSFLKRNLPVKVYGIRGNHGRTGKDTDVASNWDIMIYEILDFWSRLVLKNPKLQIKFAETEQFIFDIRGHKYMIRHQCPEQGDSPAGRVKFNEWARQYGVEGIVFGHYHHFGLFDVDSIRVFRGGSLVGADSLSDSMAKHNQPIQLLWGVNEERVSTFFYAVDLNEKKTK